MISKMDANDFEKIKRNLNHRGVGQPYVKQETWADKKRIFEFAQIEVCKPLGLKFIENKGEDYNEKQELNGILTVERTGAYVSDADFRTRTYSFSQIEGMSPPGVSVGHTTFWIPALERVMDGHKVVLIEKFRGNVNKFMPVESWMNKDVIIAPSKSKRPDKGGEEFCAYPYTDWFYPKNPSGDFLEELKRYLGL